MYDNVNFDGILEKMKVAQDLFVESWAKLGYRDENQSTAFRWFCMGYAGTYSEIEELQARIAELEKKVKELQQERGTE